MGSIRLEKREDVFVLHMEVGENRFNAEFLDDLSAALEEVETSVGAGALVITGQGKYFSNGLDLDWLVGQGDSARGFVADMLVVFARVLGSGMATVAAINGHAFAGGAMFALACDYRVMRVDRGYFCLPEIDLGIPLVDGMTALIKEKITSASVLRDAVLSGARFNANQAVEAGFVDAVAAEAEVVDRAFELVAPLATKDRATRAALKRGLYADTLRLLEDKIASVKGA